MYLGTQVQKAVETEAEAHLIQRFLAGEREIFHDLIRPYDRMYYRQAFSILRNQEDAEEAVQQAMIGIFTHLSQLTERDKFRQWGLRIVQNEAKMIWKKRRQNLYESIDEGAAGGSGEMATYPKQYADWRDLPSEAVEKREVREAVRRAIGELPEIYREVFVLRDVQQLNLAETMEVLGMNESVVKTRLHRARLMLRESLSPIFAKPERSVWERWRGMNPWFAARR
jgi:RNA polymerase sigma-70 factor (ECF subfamily)